MIEKPAMTSVARAIGQGGNVSQKPAVESSRVGSGNSMPIHQR
jgi:hypothetical protein